MSSTGNYNGGKGKDKKDNHKDYTPLTKTKAQIYAMHKHDNKGQKLRKMKHQNRDITKWCDFHKDFCHITYNCNDLRENLEDVVRQGY